MKVIVASSLESEAAERKAMKVSRESRLDMAIAEINAKRDNLAISLEAIKAWKTLVNKVVRAAKLSKITHAGSEDRYIAVVNPDQVLPLVQKIFSLLRDNDYSVPATQVKRFLDTIKTVDWATHDGEGFQTGTLGPKKLMYRAAVRALNKPKGKVTVVFEVDSRMTM